ncbi:MAG: HipA domain-containing protein [Oscillospiraceae bacterium]|nr:HipA domain-containing protein [Oscillospiraceae bacterium]
MDYTLMHKNIPVVDIKIDEDTGNISKVSDIHEKHHLPIAVYEEKKGISRKALNDWWIGRSIPASRDGIKDALISLRELGIVNTTLLLTKCYGLCLSDQYWVRPAEQESAPDSNLRWESINFFQNDFSMDIGEILFGHEPADFSQVNLISPDNTSDGWLRKKWLIINGKRFLMKGASGVMKQEPYNEVIACAIMRRFGINHVNYELVVDNGKPYSLCENFVTPDTELVPAWRVREVIKKDNRDSNFTHFLRCCEHLGILDVRAALDQMLILDYIISNEDRHYNNFGFIRNAETLEWLGLAPLYDNGTSLWYNTMRVGSPVESKPFRSSHFEQIKLVKDKSRFDLSVLDGIEDEIMEIFKSSNEVDQSRRAEIAKSVMKQASRLLVLPSGKGTHF